MKKIITTLGFLSLVLYGRAQTVTPTVVSSDGGFSTSAQGSIAWTIGEPVSDTYKTGSNITTNGFHQPEMELATLIKEQQSNKDFLVYPNPVKDYLQINFSGIARGNYKLELVDAIGKLIYSSDAKVSDDSAHLSIKVNEYAAGTYMLNVTGENFYKTIKINKVN